ncbi:hypothetical protein A3K86_21560 [Photobacterium jeanii]|uniref:Carboxylic ester hydrolase n=1 Tax=Photobacterium jeanii TaxID=858640 RepID=A0A178K2I4_9GAMM|nr:carboxylesterase family protein [Photobacterium jeanii]OAN11518.1 hypothetical protein A3K86_21560 [Photobacterium jeanii]PST91036.1 hypothetical protein C9I91_10665 [Photobacterium jeanii]
MLNNILLKSPNFKHRAQIISSSLFALLLAGCNGNDNQDQEQLVFTYAQSNGTQYQGLVEQVKNSPNVDDQVEVFKGIKYAEANRFELPHTYQPSNPLLTQALTFGKMCPQGKASEFDSKQMSEDCLYLNVWRPTKHYDAPLPVYVFIHGGAFEAGSGSKPLNHGDAIVANANHNDQPILAVTLNYRLGIFGALNLDNGTSGNFGIHDQRMALKWVKEHIADFGGNPDNVTLFGESAGAMSVGIHQLNPNDEETGEPLFHHAIMQSNPYGIEYKNFRAAKNIATKLNTYKNETFGTDANNDVSWDSLSTQQVMKIGAYSKNPNFLASTLFDYLSDMKPALSRVLAFAPYSEKRNWPYKNPEHSVLLSQPHTADFSSTPTVISFNDSEANAFTSIFEALMLIDRDITLTIPALGSEQEITFNPKYATYPALVSALLFPKKVDTLLNLPHYKPSSKSESLKSTENIKRLRMLIDDMVFTCPSRKVAKNNQARLYHYNYKSDFPVWSLKTFLPSFFSCFGSVCHADELPFVFNKALNIQSTPVKPSPKDKQMMSLVSGEWFKPEMFTPTQTSDQQDTVWMIDRTGIKPVQDWDRAINAIPNNDGTLSAQGRCEILENNGFI